MVRPAVPVMLLLTVVVPLPVRRTPSAEPRARVGTEMVLPVVVPPLLAIVPLLELLPTVRMAPAAPLIGDAVAADEDGVDRVAGDRPGRGGDKQLSVDELPPVVDSV